jgi:hypothetical protein
MGVMNAAIEAGRALATSLSAVLDLERMGAVIGARKELVR